MSTNLRQPTVDKYIARLLVNYRIRKGWSQDEFAAKVGMSQPALYMYENGKTQFTMAALLHFADKLNIPWTNLIDGVDRVPRRQIPELKPKKRLR